LKRSFKLQRNARACYDPHQVVAELQQQLDALQEDKENAEARLREELKQATEEKQVRRGPWWRGVGLGGVERVVIVGASWLLCSISTSA